MLFWSPSWICHCMFMVSLEILDGDQHTKNQSHDMFPPSPTPSQHQFGVHVTRTGEQYTMTRDYTREIKCRLLSIALGKLQEVWVDNDVPLTTKLRLVNVQFYSGVGRRQFNQSIN